MNLFCITLTFDSGETSVTHLAMPTGEEMQRYLDDQKKDFEEAGVVKCSYFHVYKTDNDYRVSIKD